MGSSKTRMHLSLLRGLLFTNHDDPVAICGWKVDPENPEVLILDIEGDSVPNAPEVMTIFYQEIVTAKFTPIAPKIPPIPKRIGDIEKRVR